MQSLLPERARAYRPWVVHVVVVLLVASVGLQETRKEVGNQRLRRHQAGTNDGDIDLDGAPVRHGDKVPRGIFGEVELLQPDYAEDSHQAGAIRAGRRGCQWMRRCIIHRGDGASWRILGREGSLQKAEAEQDQECDFHPDLHLDVEEDGQGQEEYQEIGRDVHPDNGPQEALGQTSPLHGWIP